MKLKLFLIICSVIILSCLSVAASPLSQQPSTQIPVWQIERDGRISYIVGTLPLDQSLKTLPPYYRDLIRSKPKFLTENYRPTGKLQFESQTQQLETRKSRFYIEEGDTSQILVEMSDSIVDTLANKSRQLTRYLTPQEKKFVKQTMRRLALTKTPRWKQILIPGYAGLVSETSAQIAPHILPPFYMGIALISAATGLGLGSGPTTHDLLQQFAEREKRDILSLKFSLVTQHRLFLKSVGPKQLKNLIEFIQSQQVLGKRIALIPAIEQLVGSIDAETAAEITRINLRDIDHKVNQIVSAHDGGGAVISMGLLDLVGSSGQTLFDDLSRNGFTVTRVNGDNNSSDACQKLLQQ